MTEHAYYAVGHGKKPGVYEKWSDAQEQTKDFPQPVYKKFTNKEEAEEYVKVRRPEGVSLKVDEGADKFYAIARGKMVGVFTDYNEVKKHIADYPQPLFKKFDKLDEAKDYFKKYSGVDETSTITIAAPPATADNSAQQQKQHQEGLKTAASAKSHADDAHAAAAAANGDDDSSKESAAAASDGDHSSSGGGSKKKQQRDATAHDGEHHEHQDKHHEHQNKHHEHQDKHHEHQDNATASSEHKHKADEPEAKSSDKPHKTHASPEGHKRAHDAAGEGDGVDEKSAKTSG